jgi:Subtilisin inhibitor-like
MGCGLTGVTAGPALAQTAVAHTASGLTTAAGTTAAPGWPGHHPRRRQPEAQLWIAVRQAAHGPVLRWTLMCRPDRGRLPHPSQACARLTAAQRPFAPVPHGVACPMIDYGPQTAKISGLWRGVWITARFSRVNGCQENRWNKITAVLGLHAIPGQVNPGGPMRVPVNPGGRIQGQVNPGGPMQRQTNPGGPMQGQVNPGGPMRP